MKRIVILFLCLFTGISSFAQYKRVKIYADEAKLMILQQQGVAIDHGVYKKGVFFIGEFSPAEIQKIEAMDLSYDVLVEDLEKYYADQLDPTDKSIMNGPCDGAGGFVPEVPENFELGSMAGFLTYQEFLDNLDSMAAAYPELITVRAPIDTFLTHEGREIYWVKISDNPNTDEDEPEALYTSIHHAREPASLSQNIFYMWYLLENYETDDNIKSLVDSRELYFVPMINPDGYIQNETANPNGGGMWRKNKRDNDGSLVNAGVDLNRNYSYEWGGLGTSSDYNSEVYRGPYAFSEPETQAIKWLTENRDFAFALNYHTHGNWLLFPFGFDYDQFSEDHDLFTELTEEMVRYNNYTNTISSGLYPAAGDSDDWMYGGDLEEKPKIFAMTPEVGSSFWPNESSIEGLCQENVYQNLMMARFSGQYAKVDYTGAASVNQLSFDLEFAARRMGLIDGDISISFTSLTAAASIVGDSEFTMESPEILHELNMEMLLEIDPDLISNGDIVQIEVVMTGGDYVETQVVDLLYGVFEEVYEDDCEDLNGFITADDWDVTDEDAYTPVYSITDSPYSEYANNESAWIQLAESVDLTGDVVSANMTFWAKWEIETGWDFVQVLASDDNGSSWTPLCGNYTNPGSEYQDEGQPLYDGFQTEWVEETVVLDDFIGSEIFIAFYLESDTWETEDGFYFDDLSINLMNTNTAVGVEDIREIAFNIYPNPANTQLTIQMEQDDLYHYELIDALGKVVVRSRFFGQQEQLDVSILPIGMYSLRLWNTTETPIIKKLQILH